MCLLQIAWTRFGNLGQIEDEDGRFKSSGSYYGGDSHDMSSPQPPQQPTTTLPPVHAPDVLCDSPRGNQCIQDCLEYVKEQCPSAHWNPACGHFSLDVQTKCNVLEAPSTAECGPWKGCIEGAAFADELQVRIREAETHMTSCHAEVRNRVDSSSPDSLVDKAGIITDLQTYWSCSVQQINLLNNQILEEVGRAASAELSRCRQTTSSSAKECENRALVRIANQTGKSALGEKRKVLEDGARLLAKESVQACINRTVGNATAPRAEHLSHCMELVRGDYFVSVGDTADLLVALQHVSNDRGIGHLEACLTGLSPSGAARFVHYERHRMTSSTLQSFDECTREAQMEFVKYGGVGLVEAALRERAPSIAASKLSRCSDGTSSQTMAQCKDDTRSALQNSGFVSASNARDLQDGASREAIAIRRACVRGGGATVVCDEEARASFSALGGNAPIYQASAERARLQDARRLSLACIRAASTPPQRDECKAEVEKNYVLSGGDVRRTAVVMKTAAGSAANVEMKACYGLYHAEVTPVSYKDCTSRARSIFESAGGRESDFVEYAWEVAKRDAGGTLEACLEEAECLTSENGMPTCSNTIKENLCYERSHDLLKFGTGQSYVRASDLAEAQMEERRFSISDEMSGCTRERLAMGTIRAFVAGIRRNCTASDDDVEECLAEASRNCRSDAQAAYQASGGIAPEFLLDMRRAAQMAMRAEMKSCALESLEGTSLSLTGSATEIPMELNQTCEERARQTMLRSVGNTQFFEVYRARAANIELEEFVSACILANLLNSSHLEHILSTSTCLEIGCHSDVEKRLAAAHLCMLDARPHYEIAGGVIDDMEMQARQWARFAISDRNLACRRSPTASLQISRITVTSEGHLEALCLEEISEELATMVISSDELALEVRNAAAVDTNNRMMACLEAAGYVGEVVFEEQMDMETNGTHITSNRDIIARCRRSVTFLIAQAGQAFGQIGDMASVFDAGARMALTTALRQCIFPSSAISSGVDCNEVGLTSFILSGGDMDRLDDEMKLGARESMREKIKACLVGMGEVLSYVKDILLYGNEVEQEDMRSSIALCIANATDELAIIVNQTDPVEVPEMQRRMRLEAANASVVALSNLQQGETTIIFDEALLEMLVLGAKDEDAESEMSDYFGCVEKVSDLCSVDQLFIKLNQKERCCAGVFLQEVNLDLNEVLVPGKGVAAFKGSGREATYRADPDADTQNGQTVYKQVNGACFTVMIGSFVLQSHSQASGADCAMVPTVHNLGAYSDTSNSIQNYKGGSGTCYNGAGRESTVQIRFGPSFDMAVVESPTCFYAITVTLKATETILRNMIGGQADAMTTFEKYCLGESDGIWDPMCKNTREQVASSVSVSKSVKANSESTTMVTMSAHIEDGGDIATGRIRKDLLGRQAYSAVFQVEDSKCDANCNISGDGRVIFGRARFGADVDVDADVSVNELHLETETTMEIMGRIVFAREPDVLGSISANVVHGAGRIRIIGAENAIFDNAPDSEGDFAGAEINRVIPADVKTDSRKPEWASRCRRLCRAYGGVADRVTDCRDFGGSYHTDRTSKWAFQAGNVDCLKPLKRCIKVCLYGVNREIKQTIDYVALEAGGLTISPGVELNVNELWIPIGEAGFVAGAPDDDATDEHGQEKGTVPSVKIWSLPLSQKVHLGCDLTANNRTVERRACVDLPADTDVRSLTVRVARRAYNATLGRPCFRLLRSLSPNSGGALVLTHAYSPAFPIMVEDEDGTDVTHMFKKCCWQNGIGIAPHASNDVDCASCPTSTTTSSNTTSTTSTSTTSTTSTNTTRATTSTNTTTTTTSTSTSTTTTVTTTSSNTTTTTRTTTTSTTTTNTTVTTTGTSTNTSTTSSTSTSTTTTTPPPQVEGFIILLVSDPLLFITNPKVKAALRVAFASLLDVMPHFVIVELSITTPEEQQQHQEHQQQQQQGDNSSRRLTTGSVTVYYRINLPHGSNAWLQAEKMNRITIEEIQAAIISALQRQGIMQPIEVLFHTSGSVDVYEETTINAATLRPVPSTTTRYVRLGRTNSAGGSSLIRVGLMCVAFSLGLYLQ